MAIGLLGRKIGMTRLFMEDGISVPITVVEIVPNRISQIKTKSIDGYDALQLTGGERKANKVNKPLAGHFAKAAIEAGDSIREFKIEQKNDDYVLGQIFKVNDVFVDGQFVDVTATSKGKGFAGTVKRYNFRTQDASHGNSRSHRVLGSTGQNQSPGKVFKGKKMPGQMGNERCTIQNLKVVKVDKDRNLLMIKGAVPGCPGAKIMVSPARKINTVGSH